MDLCCCQNDIEWSTEYEAYSVIIITRANSHPEVKCFHDIKQKSELVFTFSNKNHRITFWIVINSNKAIAVVVRCYSLTTLLDFNPGFSIMASLSYLSTTPVPLSTNQHKKRICAIMKIKRTFRVWQRGRKLELSCAENFSRDKNPRMFLRICFNREL